MSDSPGQFWPLSIRADAKNGSANLVGGAALADAQIFGLGSFFLVASRGVPQPAVSIAHRNVAGTIEETFGGLLFERVLILPSIEALGFVITATQFPVEVWNTFRNADQTLESITVAGTGGLTIDDVYGEPLVYGALDSFIYQATVPSTGPAQIAQTITFAFLSGATAVLSITGSRITLFSVAPEWGEGMVETFEYLTDVLVAYDDTEQRRGLRQLPRRAMHYRALTLNARNAAGMESLVWGWQNQPYGVPWWPDAQPLLANLSPGSFTIEVNTADRQFAVGGLVCIWVDEFTFEALTIEDVASGSITTSSPTQFAWTAGPGTRVIPVFLCRLPASVDLARLTNAMDQIDLSFIGEAAQPAPAPTITPTQFMGFDVLEVMPNWDDAPLRRSYKRSMVTIDPKIGPIEVVDKGGTAVVRQEFPWWLDTHPVVTTFRAFMLRRFGRLNPFWIPTWDQDLVLAADVASTDTGILIESVYYTRFFFPNNSRRFLALIPFDGSGNVYAEVTSSVDNGNGTESLTLSAEVGKVFSAAAAIVSFLTFARLSDDAAAIRWASTDHADAIVELQELPREIP